MRKWLAVGLLMAGWLGAAEAEAQTTGILPLAIGVRAGAAFPTGDFGEDDLLETGWGFEVNAQFRVAPMIALYAAYDRWAFEADASALGADIDAQFVDDGFAGGAYLYLPFGGLSPWVRAGAVYNQIELDIDEDIGLGDNFESDRSLGYEVGAGLSFPLGMVITLTPGVRYRSYAPEFEGDSGGDNVSYLVAEFGGTFRF